MRFLVIGLGNREGYKKTRHNIGKEIVKKLAGENKFIKKGKALFYEDKDLNLEFAITDGNMNSSGLDLRERIEKYKSENILVIHDEIDLLPGKIKMSFNKSDGGHNGVKSIAQVIGSNSFYRYRVGIGRKDPIERFVLGNIGFFDKRKIDKVVKDKLTHSIIEFTKGDKEKALQLTNSKS